MCVCLWMNVFSVRVCVRALLPPTIWALFGEIFCKNHSHAVAGLPLWKAAPGRNSVLLLLSLRCSKKFLASQLEAQDLFLTYMGVLGLVFPSKKQKKKKRAKNTSEIHTRLHSARLQYHRITVDKQLHVCVTVDVRLHHINIYISIFYNCEPGHGWLSAVRCKPVNERVQ